MTHPNQAPVALLANGSMLALDERTANIVIQFLPPDAHGCITVAAMHIRPNDSLAEVRIDSDIDEKSRVKFARFLEAIARSLRHYKPGQAGLEDIPKENNE